MLFYSSALIVTVSTAKTGAVRGKTPGDILIHFLLTAMYVQCKLFFRKISFVLMSHRQQIYMKQTC